MADRRPPGARGLRLLRDRVPRPSGPATAPAARGLRGLAAAAGLPDGRRAGDLHQQGARGAGEALEPEQELMTINLGPHHPATHGVLRLLVSLQGEQVVDLKPIMGYVHT